jgi:hypothetical protein
MLSSELTPMVAPRASLDAPIAATCYSLKATLKGSSKDSDLVFVVHQRGEGYNSGDHAWLKRSANIFPTIPKRL